MSIGTRASGAGRRAKRREPPKRRFALRYLSVSSRLIAVIVLALITGLVFGGLRVADGVGSADQFGRVARLANLGEQVTILVQDIQNERDETAAVLGGVNPSVLKPLYAATDAAAVRAGTDANSLGGDIPANIVSAVAAVVADTGNLGAVRNLARAEGNPTLVITDYSGPISDMTALTSEITQGVSDATLSNDVRTLDSLAAAKEEAAEQRALLFNAVTQGSFDIGVVTAVNAAASQQQLDEAAFQTTATPAQQSAFAQDSGSPSASEAATLESFLLTDGDPFADLVNLGISQQKAPATWYSLMSDEVNQMQGTELGIAADIVTRAESLQQGATRSAQVSAVITGVALFVVLLAALLVARSLVLPLRRLRDGALDVASVQLPERVRRLSESPDPADDLEVAPIPVLSDDEIGQVARAFDQVHAEAVRLAGNEALLRSAFNAMFVNLSRRSQSLIERLARMIESQEQNEDDPDRLSNLFSMDHLVTRMRRNSENLLLLAGHESPRKWTEPVALADVTRAASSEIEQYSRVVLNVPPGMAVVGPAVSDVVHLLAELIENATIFSPKETPVQLSAQELTSGGVLIEVTDKGIGVSESRMAEMNWRLDHPPVMDVSVSRHMGLFAVARLAERHRIRIRLRSATPQGLTALVWLPDTVIERSVRAYRGTGSWQSGAQGDPLQSRHPSGQHSIAAASAASQRGNGKHSVMQPGDSTATQDRQDSVTERPPATEATSNWFRSRHTALGAQARMPVNGGGNGQGADNGEAVGALSGTYGQQPSGWGAAGTGDLGTGSRQPADIVADPVQGDQTSAGLPMRVPKANLIPGSALGARNGGPGSRNGLAASVLGSSSNETHPLSARLPQRSPDLARSRLSGFQRGARRAESQPPAQEREPTVELCVPSGLELAGQRLCDPRSGRGARGCGVR
ncbi:MAG TPA: nitrate- and nitrite sensing domain-containing protein [Streptosporangiaceae bacterium]|nr:nitrate- and nitrite sensing domain-containing protein [Streptosporangiaceae bacterium]